MKQSLLRWLSAIGAWATHPMWTESVTPQQARALSQLLVTRLLSQETLTTATDREAYLAPARECRDHVFLDPDTGIRLDTTGGKRAPLYVFGTELVAIADARPEALMLVFDQSLARGREREQLEGKLSALALHGLHSVAYVSHACFVLVGTNRPLVKRAFEVLKTESKLPESRFVKSQPRNNQRTKPGWPGGGPPAADLPGATRTGEERDR
ncbi:MAG TPA: hypothetical protein VJU18_14615 [Vicinamibacteria bacterium]|nr:hypothetical protein [Vicinamibacteria bacterium]